MYQQKKSARSKSHGRVSGAAANFSRPGHISDILPSMIVFINSFDAGSTCVKSLQERFTHFPIDEIWSFVLNNPTNFFVEPQNRSKTGKNKIAMVPVWVKTDLHLCEKHCRKGKTCTGICGKLHLCRTFLLLGDMCCPFFKAGKVCAFGHKLDTQHNGNLLTAHNLRSFSENELRKLFRRRICRSVSTMPQICIYYNGKGGKGCSNKQCKSLHLCLDFVMQRCHGICKKNHSMSSEQVALNLDLFAIDTSWADDAVLEDLRSIMQQRILTGNDDVASIFSTDSNTIDDDDESETGLKDFAGMDDNVDDHKQCCSHCKELRNDMDNMMVKMKMLEGQMQDLQFQVSAAKTSTSDVGQSDSTAEKPLVLKEVFGEKLFPLVMKMEPDDAGKITGMLLELDCTELMELLSSPEKLKEKVLEAVQVLKAFAVKTSTRLGSS